MADTLSSRLVIPAALWLALALPGAARAAEPEQPPAAASDDPGGTSEAASAAFAKAAALAQEGRLSEALQAMESAAALDPTPPVLLNLGRLREETGDLAGAAQAYKDLLARSRDPRLRNLARERRESVEKRQHAKGAVGATAAACPPPAPCPVCAAPPKIANKAPVCPACPTCPAPPEPLWRKPWFWVATVGGALVLAGAAAGITYALTRPGEPTMTTTTPMTPAMPTPDPLPPGALVPAPAAILRVHLPTPGLLRGSF